MRDITITRGRPWPFLDALARFMALGNKLLFLNARFEDHEVPAPVEAAIADFAAHHELHGLHVRLNEYAPLDDLRRLFFSGRVNILLRLFLGLPMWLALALVPGRIFGGDHYNPFTDTVNLYTGHPAVALHELGHALDFRRRSLPGLYALTRYIPGVALYQEYLASKYAIDFMRERGMHDDELRAWRLLFPAYSTYVFGALVELFPSVVTKGLLLPAIGIGHLLGISYAMKREVQLDRELVVHKPTVATQWQEELGQGLAEISPSTRRGRDTWGIFLGMTAGSALCGAGAVPGAWVGWKLARRAEATAAAAPRQLGAD